MRHWVFLPAVIAPVAPVTAWCLAQFRQPPEYDWVRQTISALAARGAPDRWIMTVGLFVLGCAHLLTAAGLPEIGVPGRTALGVGGAATIAVAALPQPATGHLIAAGIALSVLAVWPLLARAPAARMRWTATAVLLVLLAWFGWQLRGGGQLGLSERILVAAEALWPLLAALAVTRRVRRTPPAVRLP